MDSCISYSFAALARKKHQAEQNRAGTTVPDYSKQHSFEHTLNVDGNLSIELSSSYFLSQNSLPGYL